MANRWKQNLNEKDVTHEDLFLNRRRLIKNLASVGITGIGLISGTVTANAKNNEKVNNWEEITSYNNFYEFGTSKDDPLRFAQLRRVFVLFVFKLSWFEAILSNF